MPEGTPVAKCVKELTLKYGKPAAIRICQKTTGLSYATGKPPEHKSNDEQKDK